MGVWVGIRVDVGKGVRVEMIRVAVGVRLGVQVGQRVSVGRGVWLGTGVLVNVCAEVDVRVGVSVRVGVLTCVGVFVHVLDGIFVTVHTSEAVGEDKRTGWGIFPV